MSEASDKVLSLIMAQRVWWVRRFPHPKTTVLISREDWYMLRQDTAPYTISEGAGHAGPRTLWGMPVVVSADVEDGSPRVVMESSGGSGLPSGERP
jgi:hypothetical protein